VSFEKVLFGFFIVLALTLNFGFFVGDIDNPDHHDAMELGAALAVSLIATIMKFGDRSQMGAVLLATSLVADLQLLAAAFVWGYATYVAEGGMTGHTLASVVSLSGGALLANLISVTLLVAETITMRR
jgi:putative Ca2+/H+ antiporter (TMEM165/GDT1 family)